MPLRYLLPLIVASIFNASSRLSAQTIEKAIDGIRPGTMVRIAIGDSLYVGRMLSRTRYDVNIDQFGQSLAIPSSQVARLWIAEGRATWDGFAAGALIGGGLGLVIGFLYGGMWCESSCAGQLSDNMISAAVTGAAAFGVVGAALGSLSPHWSPRFP